MSLIGSWFGRKEAAPAPASFDFAFGAPGLEELLRVVNAASAANDEAQMRAVLAWVETHVSREEGDSMEASKPSYAALVLGQWLMKGKRFGEAEKAFKRGRGWKRASVKVFLDLRLALADAIWEQGERDQAWKEALDFAAKAVDKIDNRVYPMSDYRAKLAKYRFDFAEQAQWEAKAFEEGLNDKPGDLEKRRADPRLQLKTALAFHEAGRDTAGLEHLERALECAHLAHNREIEVASLRLMVYWRSRSPDWARSDELVARCLEVAGDDAVCAPRARQLAASVALYNGRFAEAARLLEEAKRGESFEAEQIQLLSWTQALASTQGDWDEARRCTMRKAALCPVMSRLGSRHAAMNHLGRAELELRANYCGERAQLDTARAALEQTSALLRGDRKMELWVRGFEAVRLASQGQRNEARELAQDVEIELGFWNDSRDTLSNVSESLATAWLLLGEPLRAVSWGQQLVALLQVPLNLASARELLARAYFQSGDTSRARELWSQVTACDFDSNAVRLARRALKELL